MVFLEDDFFRHLQGAVAYFREFDRNKTVRIISHLDADGISAAAIMARALERENFNFSISIFNQLDEENCLALANEDFEQYIFTDLGSGKISMMNKKLRDKKIIILDHHEPEDTKPNKGIFHVNPRSFGIETNHVSGSGVVYFFAKELNQKNKEMAHIAIVGAIGDIQENQGFRGLNKKIQFDAVAQKKLKVINGIRLFGTQTKPLYKVLEYANETRAIGIINESTAVQFLKQAGIEPKKENKWRRLIDLDEEEIKNLATALVVKRLDLKDPENILGPVYILTEEKEGTALRDAKEFSTLLNACGRMNKASLGIGVCLGDEKIKKKAMAHLANYRKELVKAIKWFNDNKDDEEHIIEKNNHIIINARDNVLHTMIGTLASIISKTDDMNKSTFVLSLARTPDRMSKVSLRVTGTPENTDLREIMQRLIEPLGGETGGHKFAAGGLIETGKEAELIDSAQKYFSKIHP